MMAAEMDELESYRCDPCEECGDETMGWGERRCPSCQCTCEYCCRPVSEPGEVCCEPDE